MTEAANGNKIEKIAPPLLVFKIFFFLYNGIVFKETVFISFLQGLNLEIIFGSCVSRLFKFFFTNFRNSVYLLFV